MYWSYILAIVGIFGLYLAGNKVKWAWLIGAAAQVLWIIYGIVTKQYGFILSAVAYAWVYLRNHFKWNQGADHA